MPPHSIEAEESLLSAILIDNDTLLDILEILKPEDFYRTAHQKIFASIIALFNNSEPVDLVTLNNALKEKGDLQSVGGAAYLSSIVDTVPMAENARHYAKIIQGKATLRQLIKKSTEIVQRCYQDHGKVDELINLAEQSIFEIFEEKTSKPYHPIGDLIESNFDAIGLQDGKKSLYTGVPSGFTDLDNITSGFQDSDLIIVAARPAMGKTSFCLNIARNAAVDYNVPCVIFSLEMSKEQLSMRMLCSEGKVNSSRVRKGMLNKDDMLKLTTAAGNLTEAPIYIDDSPNISTTTIRTKARRLKMDHGLGLIIIDYLQLMHLPVKAERRDLEISEISRSLKTLAKELNIPIIALSQLNRMLEQRGDKRPILSDLRESGALEQDADLVAFIYRDEIYNKDENNPEKGKAEIILSKHRNGPVGTAHLTFISEFTRFENSPYPHLSPSGD